LLSITFGPERGEITERLTKCYEEKLLNVHLLKLITSVSMRLEVFVKCRREVKYKQNFTLKSRITGATTKILGILVYRSYITML
jgi:hypothetical protein